MRKAATAAAGSITPPLSRQQCKRVFLNSPQKSIGAIVLIRFLKTIEISIQRSWADNIMDTGSAETTVADKTVQHFLQGQNLRRVFAHLCNHSTGQVTDPISYVVHIMLTCPVQMVVSEVGVAFFKDHPNALFPFTAMDQASFFDMTAGSQSTV